MENKLREVAEWEYNALRSDMAKQGEKWAYLGGFKAWYTQVFLIDEAWREIREDAKKNWGEPSSSDKCDFCGAGGEIFIGRWIFYCAKHKQKDWDITYTNEIEGQDDIEDDGELGEMMLANL